MDQKISQSRTVKRLPLSCKIIYIVFAASIILLILSILITPVADFFNDRISWIFRMLISLLTAWIPFSLAEFLLLILPVAAVSIIIYGNRRFSSSWRDMWIFCGILGAIVAALLATYILTFGIGYRCSGIDVKLGLDRKEVSTEELADTADWLIEKIDEEAKNVTFMQKSSSIMPFTFGEMSDKLLSAYDTFSQKYGFIINHYSRLKPVMLSEAMTHTHIAGAYTYFTGEININTNFPDYTLPYTAAHEMAHQRGISREDEANFVAFLVCISSDDPYIRYSGYVSAYEYLASALYYTDSDVFSSVASKIPTEVNYEMIAYNKFFEKYKDSPISSISGAVNDTILKVNGTEGVVSYGMVVDLTVAYYRSENAR